MGIGIDNRILDGLTRIEAARTPDDMPGILQSMAAAHGFSSFAFFDGRSVPSDGGSVITTVDDGWRDTYAREGYVHHDPCVRRMLTSSRPFYWSDIDTPVVGRPTPSQIPMLAAREHGYAEGLVLPLHMDDGHGGRSISSCAFFGRDGPADIRQALGISGPAALGMVATAWAEKFAALAEECVVPAESSATLVKGMFGSAPRLSGREIDVLSWAAKGKTAEETAVILGLGRETVQTHLVKAARKLKAVNKTHAVALAVQRRVVKP